MSRRLLTTVVLVVAIVAAAVAYLTWPRPAARTTETQATGATEPVPIGGPFSLVDQEGRRVTEADLQGRVTLVYFGYTFCPDMCPLGLQKITEALEKLPAEQAARVLPLFFTVDPARDTVPVMREYMASFDPRIRALTGSEAEVKTALGAYKVYSRKADPEAEADYLVDHSTFTFLMAPDGRYLAHFGHDTTAEAMAERLRGALDASS